MNLFKNHLKIMTCFLAGAGMLAGCASAEEPLAVPDDTVFTAADPMSAEFPEALRDLGLDPVFVPAPVPEVEDPGFDPIDPRETPEREDPGEGSGLRFEPIDVSPGSRWDYTWFMIDEFGTEVSDQFSIEVGEEVSEMEHPSFGLLEVYSVDYLGTPPPDFAPYGSLAAVEGILLGVPEGEDTLQVIFDPYLYELREGGFAGYLPESGPVEFADGTAGSGEDAELYGVQATVEGQVEWYRSGVGYYGGEYQGTIEPPGFGAVNVLIRVYLIGGVAGKDL